MPLKPTDHLWPVVGRAMSAHSAVYRASGGRVGHRLWPGAPPMLLLDYTDENGDAHRTSVVYVEDGKNLVVVASRAGNPKPPVWFDDLKARPDTAVQIGTEKTEVRAHVAKAAERKRLWPKALDVWGPYEGYQDRADKTIPLLILEPRSK